MKQDKILSLLSLATKAGRTKSGGFQTEQAVKTGTAFLVIVTEDASENTKKKFRNMCDYYRVPLAVYGGKEELGGSIGQEYRASLAVTDPGFAGAIRKQLENEDERRS